MKKVLLSLITIFLLSFVSFSQSSDNGLIGKARGVAHECLQNAPNGWEISGSTETIVAARLLATVDFDCENNVISYTCY